MGSKSILLALGLIIFTVILAVLFAITRFRSFGTSTPKPIEIVSNEPARNTVPVSEIIINPMVYDEYKLEIDSQITGWVANNAFYFSARIGSGFGGGTQRNLLVVAKEPFTLPQDPNDNKVGLGERATVRTTGTVEIMNKEQLEATLGIDLDDPNNALYNKDIRNWSIGPVILLDKMSVETSSK